ncbi:MULTISPECIES: TonB-dependent siderophore receptor [Idiomarina]|uniref:TonB-dependent siderophore receptor n=1 Tax=Idiomarina TaxID=135575 RepID=UPI000C5235FE|nr:MULTISPECIES: TonB-dependent siderophore receptor [Idiomarina]MBP58554.1 TonB-dependent siderophore receptor [Idiomarina sp.]|tara:strand:- start:3405 stop:5546 length:2142 start_codon:yes stop_codon:yes gene_type:complete
MKAFAKSFLATAVTSVLLTSTAFAVQSEGSDQAEQNTETKEKIFEHIKVTGSPLDRATTATGLPLTLRQTPQSISVIDRDFIDGFALDTVADVMQFAPGIQAQQAETDRFFFRSRGRDVTNFQFDGVPIAYNSFFSEALADSVVFERVEIVRGATGLLTGAGEPSAAINLIRKRPKTEDGGYASVGIGSWSNYRFEADHSQTLTEDGNVKARVAMAYEEGESYVDLSEKENAQIYAVVTADLTTQTRLTVGADYSERNPKGSMWGALPLFYDDGTQADDLPVSTTTASPWNRWDRESTNVFAQLEHAFDNGWDLQMDVERREGEMDGYLLYFSGFPNKETGEGLSASPNHYVSDREQTSFRILASGPFELLGREHQLTAGALYAEQDVNATSYGITDTVIIPSLFDWGNGVARPNFSDTPAYSTLESHTQEGIYAAAQFSLTDEFTAIIGNRLTNYDSLSESPWATSDYENSSVNTPYLGLVYDVTDIISTYASYTEIFQPQNAFNADGELIGPVEGSNSEIGIKGDFFNEALSASFAIYKIKEDNLAINDPDNTDPLPGTTIFPSIGVDGAESEGYELELNGKPTDALNIFFSYTHNESTDRDGSDYAPYLPEDMVKASVLYTATDALKLGVNANWQSDVSNPDIGPNGETFNQDSYTVVNAMANYQLGKNLDLSLNVNNLFDEKYYSSIDFYNQGFFGAERNFELSLKYAW